MFYLFIFLVSAALFLLAQNAYENENYKTFYGLSYSAIIWLSFWAGCRDVTIGTDTIIYGLDVYADAYHSTTPVFDAFEDITWIEPLFFLLNKLASYFGGFGFALFLIMFVQLTFAFHGLKHFIEKVPIWLSMLAYVLLFYNLTLNLMRQGIAIAFVLYCYKYIEQRKIHWLLIMSVVGFFWHKTSTVGFLFLIFLYFFYGKSNKTQLVMLFTAIPLIFIVLIYFLPLLEYLTESYEVLSHYSNYGGENDEMEASLSTIEIGSRLLMITLVAFIWSFKVLPNEYFYIFTLLIILDLSCKFLGVYTYNVTRLSYYFNALEIPFLFKILNADKISSYHRTIMNSAILLSFGFMLLWLSFLKGDNETYPYVSKILQLTLY